MTHNRKPKKPTKAERSRRISEGLRLVHSKPRKFYVWETEYPCEGSMTFLATSHWKAKQQYKLAWGWRPGDLWEPELTATSKEPRKARAAK